MKTRRQTLSVNEIENLVNSDESYNIINDKFDQLETIKFYNGCTFSEFGNAVLHLMKINADRTYSDTFMYDLSLICDEVVAKNTKIEVGFDWDEYHKKMAPNQQWMAII